MRKFKYKLATADDQITEGTITALFKSSAKKKLEKDGKSVIYITPDEKATLNKNISIPFFSFRKSDRILFFRDLSIMIGAGVPIGGALAVVEEQTQDPKVKKAIKDMIADIENGKTLSDSMKKYPRYFPQFLVEMVTVGEVSGRLVETLGRISDTLETQYELQRKVRSQMAYPVFVIAVMIVVLVVLTLFVVPRIADLFAELDAEMPLLTRALLATSIFVQNNPFVIIGILIGIILAVYITWRTKKGRYAIHYGFLKAPIFGQLLKEYYIAQFFRSLSSLYRSGVSLVNSVSISKKTVNNDVYRRILDSLEPSLLHGVRLSDSLIPHPTYFPLKARRMLEVGENSGTMDESFEHVNSYYERIIRHKTQTLSSLIEPILIIFIGIVVAALAFSIIVPIYQAAQFF